MVSIVGLTATFLLSAIAVTAQIPANLSTSCQSPSCQAVISKFNNTASATSCASDVTCLCSNDVASGLKSCAQCDIAAGFLDQQTADNDLATYLAGCKQAGHPVSSAISLKMSGLAAAAALSGLILL